MRIGPDFGVATNTADGIPLPGIQLLDGATHPLPLVGPPRRDTTCWGRPGPQFPKEGRHGIQPHEVSVPDLWEEIREIGPDSKTTSDDAINIGKRRSASWDPTIRRATHPLPLVGSRKRRHPQEEMQHAGGTPPQSPPPCNTKPGPSPTTALSYM